MPATSLEKLCYTTGLPNSERRFNIGKHVKILVGDKFTVKPNIQVEVVEYQNPTKVLVKDHQGNTRWTSAHSLVHGRLKWRRVDGSFKAGKLSFHGPPAYKKPPKNTGNFVPPGYYVYAAYNLKGQALYVGRGYGKRWLHCYSGKSHNRELNRMYFNKEAVIVEVLKMNLTKEESSELEKILIDKLNPKFNHVIYNL